MVRVIPFRKLRFKKKNANRPTAIFGTIIFTKSLSRISYLNNKLEIADNT